MDTLSWADYAGVLALVIVLASVGWQIYQYFQRLRVSIVDVIVPHVHKDISLVLIRVALVNPSSRNKIVCNIGLESTHNNITVESLEVEISPNLDTLTYQIPKDESQYRQVVPISEMLRTPLDILPHQSESKWLVFSLKWRVAPPENYTNLELQSPITWVSLSLYDQRYDPRKKNKPIVSCGKQILVGKEYGVSFPFYETT